MPTESFFTQASLAYLASAGAGKDGKTYSMKPTDGTGDFTFSRGSNLAATRVGADGLIEKGRENLLLQSNQFDTTPWLLNTTSATSGQSGYDGTTDAWLLNSTGTGFPRVQQNVATSGVFVFSVYAKAATDGFMLIRTFGADAQVWFDLSDGSISNEAGAQYISSTIENIGNGWYRYSVLANGSLTSVRIYPASAYGVYSTSGNGIYIQDSQVEVGALATEVIESGASTGKAGLLEDEPRFDYSGGATCPSLLLEPSRSNLISYSEYFEGWSDIINITPTSNYILSPEGVKNATRLQFTSNGFAYAGLTSTQVAGTEYTLSVYAKRNDSGTQSFGFFVNGSGSVNNAMALTNEWQRFDYTYTASNNSQSGLAGISGADVSVYGFQREAASYPTSYIPNHSGGTITRGADNCSVTGISSLFGQTEGTLFLELEPMTLNDNPFIALYANSSNYLEVNIGAVAGTQYEMRLSDGTNSTNPRGGTPQANTTFKLAIKVESGNQKTFVDGTEIISSSIALDYSSTPLSILAFNRSNGNNHFYGNVKQTLVFPEALSDADCIAITTL